MTQLFDTTTYDAEIDGAEALQGRHLRSVPTEPEFDERRSDWQLDDTTIEIGRRGIAKAREALKEAGKARATRRAA